MINQLLPLIMAILFSRWTFRSHLAIPLWPAGSSAESPELLLRSIPGRSDPLLGRGYALYMDNVSLSGIRLVPAGDYCLLMEKDEDSLTALQINYGPTPCRIYRFIYEKEWIAGRERLSVMIVFDGKGHRLYSVALPPRFRRRADG